MKSRRIRNTPRNPQPGDGDQLEAACDEKRPTRTYSPYSLASIDPGFVETGLVQLSQSVKTTNANVTHTLTDTDRWHPVRTPV